MLQTPRDGRLRLFHATFVAAFVCVIIFVQLGPERRGRHIRKDRVFSSAARRVGLFNAVAAARTAAAAAVEHTLRARVAVSSMFEFLSSVLFFHARAVHPVVLA